MRVTLDRVYKYVSSLQDAVESWYKIFNPFDSDFSPEIQIWLDKLNRIGMEPYLPLVLVYLQKVTAENKRLSFLHAVERNLFIASLFSGPFGHYVLFGNNSMISVPDLAVDLNSGTINADKVIRHLSDATSDLLKIDQVMKDLHTFFRASGFYEWRTIRYFLFEYNVDLQTRSKTDRAKIFWPEFTEQREDFISVEHIYPQQARHEYWTTRFGGLSQKQRTALKNSLGNLLPLSKPKNASLSNRPFHDKVTGKGEMAVGYCYGSYAENEVAKYSDWTPHEVLVRGLAMLAFMEKRWGIDLGDETQKKLLLGLEFLPL